MSGRGDLAPGRSDLLAALACALAGTGVWAAFDVGFVLVSVTPKAPFSLVLLSLLLAAAVSVPLGVAAWGATLRSTASAARVSFVVAFTVGGVVVLGTLVNRLWLPGLYHPLSLFADFLLFGLLFSAALLLARALIHPLKLSRPVLLALWVWVVPFAIAAIDSGKGEAWRERAVAPSQGAAGKSARGSSKKNVLMIVADSLRADALEEAMEDGSAPALAEIARTGASFSNAYSQSSWTKPSVATLLTGQYPDTHGAEGRNDALPEQMQTLGEVLSDAGYRTAVFSANPWVSPTFGFGQGVGYFLESEPGGDPSRLLAFVRVVQAADRFVGVPLATPAALLRRHLGLLSPHRTNCERDEELVSVALSWLRSKPHTPFFVYLHLMSTHLPYEPHPRAPKVHRTRQLAAQRDRSVLTPQEQVLVREDYRGTVRLVDRTIQRLIDTLRDLGLYDRTLVVVTADHGDEMYEHASLGHGKTLYPEVVRIPLLVSLPGVVPAARIVRRPASGVDVLPTVVGLLEIGVDLAGPGRELIFDAAADAADRGARVYMLLRREGGLSVASLVDGGFQYIESESPGAAGQVVRELYDLSRDPGAVRNIWNEQSVVARRMEEELRSLRAAAKRQGKRDARIDDQTRERLRSLGYLD